MIKCLKIKRDKMFKILSYVGFNKTAGCGSPCHGDGTLSNPNTSSQTGDKLDRPPDVPESSGTPLHPSWIYAFHTALRSTFCQSPSS